MTTPLPLFGRAREQAYLRDQFTSALAGQGGVVLIGGEAGAGKTALAEDLCRDAALRGGLVLVGRCYDRAETPPFGPWLDLFTRYPTGADLPPPPAAFAGDGIGDVANQAALFGTVRESLTAIAHVRPLALVLDDLHWADLASLNLLRFLARDIAALPLLLLVTYRADEVTRAHPLYALLPLLVREAGAGRVDVRPLDVDALWALVAARYHLSARDAARLVAYLRARAEGNAFYTMEVLRALEEEGALHEVWPGQEWALDDLDTVPLPMLLRQVIDGRLLRLGPEARPLLTLAAVIGAETPIDLWLALAGVDEPALLTLIERAMEARVLDESDDGKSVRFRHALIRDALYTGMPAARRVRLHLRVGEALLAGAEPDPDAVAYHLRQAGDARAARWLIRAGERAQRAAAWLIASDRFETAIDLLAARGNEARLRGWLMYHVARLRQYAGGGADFARLIVLLNEAEGLAREADDATLRAFIALLRGVTRCTRGELRHGVAEMVAGIADLEALPPAERLPPALWGEMLRLTTDEQMLRAWLITWLALVGRYAEANTHVPLVLPASGMLAEYAYDGVGILHATLGRPEEARAAFALMRAGARAGGTPFGEALALLDDLIRVVAPYHADDPNERERVARLAEDAFTHARTLQTEVPGVIARLPLLRFAPQWDDLEGLAHAAYASGNGSAFMAAPELAYIAQARDDGALTAQLIARELPEGPATVPGGAWLHNGLVVQRLAAVQAIEAGDMALAQAWLEAHDRWLAWSGTVLGRAEGMLAWAAYHHARGDHAGALAQVRAALDEAAAPRQPLALLAGRRLLGELATEAGRHAEAEELLGVALALARAYTAPYEQALVLYALALLARATGQHAEVARCLDEAHALCAPLHATSLLTRLDALAKRRRRARDRGPSTPGGLTPRQVEILRLVAAERTDREIAALLRLSERTVSNHLTHIFDRTGAGNRAAAVAFAARHGLV